MDQRIEEKARKGEIGVLTLCGGQGCCPTIDFTNPDEVVLRDDHGGTVRLKKAEWDELKEFIRKVSQISANIEHDALRPPVGRLGPILILNIKINTIRNHESDYWVIFLYTMIMLDLKNSISTIQSSNKTLFILCGFPYAGKSYIVSQIRPQADIKVVSIDDIFIAKGFDWDTNVLPGMNEWEQIFNKSYEKTKDNLLQGRSVLYDSTNQTVASRNKLREIAESVGADSCVLYIKTPVETVWQRWEGNQNNPTRSVVNRDLVQQIIDMFEEPTEDERPLTILN